jgi:hypothetical protein
MKYIALILLCLGCWTEECVQKCKQIPGAIYYGADELHGCRCVAEEAIFSPHWPRRKTIAEEAQERATAELISCRQRLSTLGQWR